MELKERKRINNNLQAQQSDDLPRFLIGGDGLYMQNGSIWTSSFEKNLSGTGFSQAYPNFSSSVEHTPMNMFNGNILPKMNFNLNSNYTLGGSIPGQISPWEGIGLSPVQTPAIQSPNLAEGISGKIQPMRFNAPTGSLKNVNVGGIISSGVQFAGDVANSFIQDRSTGDIMRDAGRTNNSVAGISYEKQKYADETNELRNLRRENAGNALKNIGSGAALGGAAGTVIPGIGTAIGAGIGAVVGGIVSIFGGVNRKRKLIKRLQESRNITNRANTYSKANAVTTYLTQDWGSKYGNEESQSLYTGHAALGKDEGERFPSNNDKSLEPVHTSFGKVMGKPDAIVAGGESIIDNIDNVSEATGSIVRDGKLGIDGPKAMVGDNTVILGTQRDWRTGVPFMIEGAPYTRMLEMINETYKTRISSSLNSKRGPIGKQTNELQQQNIDAQKLPIVAKLKELADQQRYQHEIEGYTNMLRAKRGKDSMNKYKGGKVQNWSWPVDLLGAGTGLYQFLDAKSQDIKNPYTYVQNPYEGLALSKLAGLRINPYSIIRQLRNQERRNLYAINRAGGLSGAQKQFGNIAIGIGTQGNIAQVLTDIQSKNNQYINNYAQQALNAGQSDRAARMASNQYDLEYYSKAHAAKQQMEQMGLYNMLNAAQQGYANWWKLKTHNDNMNLYRQDLNLRQLESLKGLPV